MAFRSDHKHTSESVSLNEAKERAHAFLRQWDERYPGRACSASLVANGIWPGHRMSPQGAGLAASRILQALEKDGRIRWVHDSGRRGGWKSIAPKSAKPGGNAVVTDGRVIRPPIANH